jgi:hypothetical protein
MEATRAFYEDVLLPAARADPVELGNKGVMKHYFFDIGTPAARFHERRRRRGIQRTRPGINKGLGLMPGVYHFAFNCDSLERRRDAEAAAGTRR